MVELVKKANNPSVLLDPLIETKHLNPDGTKKRHKVDKAKQVASYEVKMAKDEGKLPLTSSDPVPPVVEREVEENENWWDK